MFYPSKLLLSSLNLLDKKTNSCIIYNVLYIVHIQDAFVHTIVESVFPHELIVINFEVIGDLVHFFVSGFRLCCVLIRDIQKEKARHRQTS